MLVPNIDGRFHQEIGHLDFGFLARTDLGTGKASIYRTKQQTTPLHQNPHQGVDPYPTYGD